MKLKYFHLDIFSNQKFGGNPAAVFYEYNDLSSDLMQKIAGELNLSETVFLQKPTNKSADYKARIFTPKKELPFAGHPTIAAAFSYKLINNITKSSLTQECGAGLIKIEENNSIFSVTQKDPIFRDFTISKPEIASIFSLEEGDISDYPPQIISTGIPWLIFHLNSFESITKAVPDHQKITEISQQEEIVGVQIFAKTNNIPEIKVRTFAPICGVFEDPACGSGNGTIASFIAKYDILKTNQYSASQGSEINRDSIIHASFKKENNIITDIKIGGKSVKLIEGELTI